MRSSKDVETPFSGPAAILLGDSGHVFDDCGSGNRLVTCCLTGVAGGVAGKLIRFKPNEAAISSVIVVAVVWVLLLLFLSSLFDSFSLSLSSGWIDLKSSLGVTLAGLLAPLRSSANNFLLTGGGCLGLAMRAFVGVVGLGLGGGEGVLAGDVAS